MRVQILGSLADVYTLKGDTEQAAAQLQAIVDMDPEAPAADLARRDLAELTVRPLSASPSSNAAENPAGPAVADTAGTRG
jgi:thioredoxin-like negative regulator of GroEL